MSGRRSKKNQRLGSSRRGPKGLTNTEKYDENDDGLQQTAESEDGQNEFHTTRDYHSAQTGHPPDSTIDQQTSMLLEGPPHASSQKDLLMETELPQQKRKMGSTRKSTGGFKVEKKADEVRMTEEFNEEYVGQPKTTTTEEQHGSLLEQLSLSSFASLQTQSSRLERAPGATLMTVVPESQEKDAIFHQETTSHSYKAVSHVSISKAMGQSINYSAVTVAESDLLRDDSVKFDEPKTSNRQEGPLPSTSGQKRRMGSTRRPLGERNSENLGMQEPLRSMTENERKAEVRGEEKQEEVAQSWSDVARDDLSSHTKLSLVSNESLLAESAGLKEPDVSVGTETITQLVAIPLADPEKPLHETTSQHRTVILNTGLDLTFSSHTEDFDVLNKVLEEAGSHLSDNNQHVPDTDVNTEEVKVDVQKEPPSRNDQTRSLSTTQDAQLEELALNYEQVTSLSQHDSASQDKNSDHFMAQLTVGGSKRIDVPASNISLVEPTITSSPHEMSDTAEELKHSVCDVASVTCDTDLECIPEQGEDPQIVIMKEKESMSNKRGSETDNAFAVTDEGDIIDHNGTQHMMDVRDNEEGGETSTKTSQDYAGKMLEKEVKEDKGETENTSINGVTLNTEEMLSFDSATDTGSCAHQQQPTQTPDKVDHHLGETVYEESEKERVLFSAESEDGAFDVRSEETEGIEEVDAAPVLILDVEQLLSSVNTECYDAESDLQNRVLTEKQTVTSCDTNTEAFQGSDDASTLTDSGLLCHNIVAVDSGETYTVPEESDINPVLLEDSSDSYKLTTFYPESQEYAGDAQMLPTGGDTDLEIETRDPETVDTITEESSLTTKSDSVNSTADVNVEAFTVSENPENEISSDISIIPEDSHREEFHSSPFVHKRKMGSTRRLKGDKVQRKGGEYDYENDTLDSKGVIIFSKQNFSLEDESCPDDSTIQSSDGVGLAEGTESTFLQPSCGSDLVSEEPTAIINLHITKLQTLANIHKESQENAGDVERVPADGDTESHSVIQTENKTIDKSTFEAEETEEPQNEFIGDKVTVESNLTKEPDFFQNDTFTHAKPEALKESDNGENVSAGANFEDPLKTLDSEGMINTEQENFSLEDKPSLDESTSRSSRDEAKEQESETGQKDTFGLAEGSESIFMQPSCSTDLVSKKSSTLNICSITEPQTLTDIYEEYQENAGHENAAVEKDTYLQLEIESQSKTFDSTTSKAEGTEENNHGVSVKEVEVFGDTITVISNMNTESDFHQSSSDAHMEALKVSENVEHDVAGKTNIIPNQSDISIFPEDSQREEARSKSSPIVQKRKMGSTRRPLKGNTGPRKGHQDENETHNTENRLNTEKETFSLEDEPSPYETTLRRLTDAAKEQKRETSGDHNVGFAEGSESTCIKTSYRLDLESEESTALSIFHVTEPQTLTNIHEESQVNAGDVKKVATHEDREIQTENKTIDLTSEENNCGAGVLVGEVEIIKDIVTVEGGTTAESHVLQTFLNSETFKVSENPEKDVSGDIDTILKQSDTNIIPEDIHREEAHPKTSPVVSKRKMGSTRRPLRGNKGQRKDHDEKEISFLDDESSPGESTYTVVSISDISESQTLTKFHEGSQENAGDVEKVPKDGNRELHSEIQTENRMIDLTSEAEENNCGAGVLVGDTVTVESNMTAESDVCQNDTFTDAKLEAHYKAPGETDMIPKQSDINIIPEDVHREEGHTKLNPIVHKRKMGSTRRPLKGNIGQRKGREPDDEDETLDSDVMISTKQENVSLEDECSRDESTLRSSRDKAKGQERETGEKEDAGLVEGSESTFMQLSHSTDVVYEESAAESISNITESQSLTKIPEESQKNPEDAERGAAVENVDLHLEVKAHNKSFDTSITDDEGKEQNIPDTVLFREVEIITDTVTVEGGTTAESHVHQTFLNSETFKVSENAEKDVSGDTDTILKQSDTNIIPEDIHREEAHPKTSPVVSKRKMGSTRRPLRGNKGQRKDHDEKEILFLDDEPNPDESTYTVVSISDMSESQTLTKFLSQENAGDIEKVPKDGDRELHSEIQTENRTIDLTFEAEENNCGVGVLVGDTVTVESNMTAESDVCQNDTFTDAKLEAHYKALGETDMIPKQSDINIIPEDVHREEEHTKLSPIVHKRKMGSTRRPLKGNIGQREVREESNKNNAGLSEEEETEMHLETQAHDGMADHSVTQEIWNTEHYEDEERKATHQEQRTDVYQTQTGPSQDETGSHLLEVSEKPTDSIGSTRKRGKRMVSEEDNAEEKEEVKNTAVDDEATKLEDKIHLEEATTDSPVHQQLFSSSTGKGHDNKDTVSKSNPQAQIPEQNDPNSTINPELLIESECSSHVKAEMVLDLALGVVGTNLVSKQSVISEESHREDQSKPNPVVQKRKMGSTRKTLRGNKGQGRQESKHLEIESEGMTKEQDTEPHSATSECKFDKELEQNQVEFSHPAATSNKLSETDNEVKEVSLNIHDRGNEERGIENAENYANSNKDSPQMPSDILDQRESEPEQTENTCHFIPIKEFKNTLDEAVHVNSSQEPATQEKKRKMGSTRRNPRGMLGRKMSDYEDALGMADDSETKKAEDELNDTHVASSITQFKEVSPGAVSTTDLESKMLGENDYQNNFGPENTLQICDNQLVTADVAKHLQPETVTSEKKRKMGSTRKTLREGRIQKRRDGNEDTETAETNLQISPDSEMSSLALEEPKIHSYSSQSDNSLLSEIERALIKTSESSLNYELIINEANSGDLVNVPDLSMQENSDIKSLQLMPPQGSKPHSEPNSPERRRRKMGSTRRNPRQQLKADRDDEDKEGELEENLEMNKQEVKDLERVEVSAEHKVTENQPNKEYLDVPSAHTSSQQEESANPAVQENASPSTKRKFGSRRSNKGKQGLGRPDASDRRNELEDGDDKPDNSEVNLHNDGLADQRIPQPFSEQSNMETRSGEAARKGSGAGLVSLDHVIKHDRSTGTRQTVTLKNRISDTEVVQFNVVMVGNSCVGKTSFIRRFHEGQFTEDYRSTIGVDTCVQTVTLPDRTVKLQIWDTAGQERFHSITTQVFHKADGLLLMYEITCSKSFLSVRDWISQAQEKAPNDVIMMLLGNKSDSVKREVQVQEGADLAREYNIHFLECSAANGINVSESMRTLAELLVQRKRQREEHTMLRREPPQKKSGCC